MKRIYQIFLTGIAFIMCTNALAMHSPYAMHNDGRFGQQSENDFYRYGQHPQFARRYIPQFNNRYQRMHNPYYRFNRQPYMVPGMQGYSGGYQLSNSQHAMMALTKYMQTGKPQDLQLTINYILKDLTKNYSPRSWWGRTIFVAAIHQVAQTLLGKLITTK